MSASGALADKDVQGAARSEEHTGRRLREGESVVGRLAAAHRACANLRGAPTLDAGLRELAESFRGIFAAALVVVDWFDPSEPARGSSPADAELATWWAPWQSRVDQSHDGPVTAFTVPDAERVGALADIERLVVIELSCDGRHGAVGIGYASDWVGSDEELTALAILGEHLASVLAVSGPAREAALERTSSTRARGTDELIAIAAHELRTPLTPITMLLQSLERKGRTGAVDLEAIARTRRQVGRLTKMIADLLDLSRLRRDRLALQPEAVGLAALVADAVRGFREGEQKNEVDTVVTEQPLQVMFDRERLQQSLTCWLEHVARVSPPGSPLRVSVDRRGRFASIVVAVANDEPGSSGPPSTGLRVPTTPVKGASLALAIHLSDELTAHYGGSLVIDGPCGERVTARLPLSEPDIA